MFPVLTLQVDLQRVSLDRKKESQYWIALSDVVKKERTS